MEKKMKGDRKLIFLLSSVVILCVFWGPNYIFVYMDIYPIEMLLNGIEIP